MGAFPTNKRMQEESSIWKTKTLRWEGPPLPDATREKAQVSHGGGPRSPFMEYGIKAYFAMEYGIMCIFFIDYGIQEKLLNIE